MWIRFRKEQAEGSGGTDRKKGEGYRGRQEESCFQKAVFLEDSAPLHNPGCGWYHIYTLKAQPPSGSRKKTVEEEVWLDEECREEELALVLIDIGDFRVSGISEEALGHIKQILDFFRRNQKQMILRIVYDTEGKGMAREPLSLTMVKRHMEQAGKVIRDYLDDIFVMQGIFVGNWGEMHGSKFLDRESMCELVNTLYRVTEGRCFLAVRTPAQWRSIAGSHKTEPGVEEVLALYNDGIFGSPTDMGTYGTGDRAGETGSWGRKEELEWQDVQMEYVPNGGEVLSGDGVMGYRQAAEEMEQMHLCYLNRIYHPARLEEWKQETADGPGCWSGTSGYDYIGRHLGYRFAVRDVSVGKGGKLQITVENCGFGNLCEEAECILITERKDGSAGCQCLDTDARLWRSGRETVIFVDSPGNGQGERFFLQLRRKRDGRILRFANQGADEKVLLGESADVQGT